MHGCLNESREWSVQEHLQRGYHRRWSTGLAGGESPERRIGDAGHGREENPIGDGNITYLQGVTSGTLHAGHSRLIVLSATPLRLTRPILRTILVQSRFMPTV